MVVGPSLVEIRGIYNGKPDDFVKWSVAPEKKRDGVIEMPSMIHVGEEGLRAVYTHMMKVSMGVKEVKQAEGDPFGSSPTHVVRPQVQRIFMPNASPASVAVALDENTSLCWDAGTSRLRYAWTGGFIDGFPYWKGNGSSIAKIVGKVRYTELKSPFPESDEAKFLGYKIEAGSPIFKYRIGTTTVSESFSPLEEGKGFVRNFKLDPAPSVPLVMDFPESQEAGYTSDKGKWNGHILTLAPSEASTFTVTISFK
jgi:hypothetical protein